MCRVCVEVVRTNYSDANAVIVCCIVHDGGALTHKDAILLVIICCIVHDGVDAKLQINSIQAVIICGVADDRITGAVRKYPLYVSANDVACDYT